MTAPTLTPRVAREQQSFRALLNAMSRPGTVWQVPQQAAGGVMAGAISVLESLLDHEVSFAVLASTPDVGETLLRLTGSRVAAINEADYVLCDEGSLAEAISLAKLGPLEYPDRGATIVCQVASIGGSQGDSISVSGPGVNGEVEVVIDSFPAAAREAFADRNADRPLGIDVVFVDGDGHVTCLNRYTVLREA